MNALDVADTGSSTRRIVLIMRVAGGLVLLLGLANLALGAISAFTGLIRLPGSTSLGLAALGLGTSILGVLLFRGVRWALYVALVLFGGLFVVQVFAATGGSGPAPAVVTLAVVVFPLVLALRATRDAE